MDLTTVLVRYSHNINDEFLCKKFLCNVEIMEEKPHWSHKPLAYNIVEFDIMQPSGLYGQLYHSVKHQ